MPDLDRLEPRRTALRKLRGHQRDLEEIVEWIKEHPSKFLDAIEAESTGDELEQLVTDLWGLCQVIKDEGRKL